jgi:hypothetical protein
MTRIALMALVALIPLAAQAQGQAGAAARDAAAAQNKATEGRMQAADTEYQQGQDRQNAGDEPVDPPGDPADAPEPAGTAASAARAEVPDTYTVKPGDTLWDLSGRYLNNPWYWPKVWSYNPEITNPHWIDPGTVIKFSPTEAGPTQVEVAEAPEEAPQAPREMEDLSRGTLSKEGLDDDAVAVAGPYKIGYVAPSATTIRRDSFITKRELEESGVIHASFEEKLMLSHLDRAYAKFKGKAGVKVGDNYLIYKTERTIRHPRTGAFIGYKTAILGTARITGVSEGVAKLEITSAIDVIERGDYLGPWNEKLIRQVPMRANSRSLVGEIIAPEVHSLTQMGEHHTVFIDKGKADGVQEGNTFAVVRRGDPSTQPALEKPRYDPKLPKEDIGRLLVIDAKENASLVLVLNSLRELHVGDRVEMRPDGAGGN